MSFITLFKPEYTGKHSKASVRAKSLYVPSYHTKMLSEKLREDVEFEPTQEQLLSTITVNEYLDNAFFINLGKTLKERSHARVPKIIPPDIFDVILSEAQEYLSTAKSEVIDSGTDCERNFYRVSLDNPGVMSHARTYLDELAQLYADHDVHPSITDGKVTQLDFSVHKNGSNTKTHFDSTFGASVVFPLQGSGIMDINFRKPDREPYITSSQFVCLPSYPGDSIVLPAFPKRINPDDTIAKAMFAKRNMAEHGVFNLASSDGSGRITDRIVMAATFQ